MSTPDETLAPPGLVELLRDRFPRERIAAVTPLGVDEAGGTRDATAKGVGYGVPLRITLVDADSGTRRQLVLHFARADEFGHDRRSDRAQGLLLAHDTFGLIPRHVPALDVGAVADGGRLVSLRQSGEFYLLTGWAPGKLYAEDLRRLAKIGEASTVDHRRCDALAMYLAELHAQRVDRPKAYVRAVRDLVGHGEGIFGLIDGYPPDVPGASPARLQAIEAKCVAWRWKLRGREGRLARSHGDFHPFNLVFDGNELALLDASRGGVGDPADDVTCLAVNYVFFALGTPEARLAWPRGLGELWRRFWDGYLSKSQDDALLEVCAPWLAWRALVLANPKWYPGLPGGARDELLAWIEEALEAPRFVPASAERLFT